MKRIDRASLESSLAGGSRWATESGARVATRRRSLDLSVRDVADLVDVTGAYIYDLEAGKKVPGYWLRLALGHVLACDPDDLYPMPTREAVAEFMDVAA